MYDTAITVFSPNGHLFQVEYAIEAVKKGLCAVGLVTNKSVVLAVEKKAVTKLQEERTIKKIVQLDEHIHMAYSGLTADGRILANKARMECQSYRLNYDDSPPVEYISKYVAETKQKYTQKGGVRPFGISCLIAGFDPSGRPHLYYTDPSGSFSEWRAQSCGRNSKQVC